MLISITYQNHIISTRVAFKIITMNIILKFDSGWHTFDMQTRFLKLESHVHSCVLSPFHI
jgi:hypothetical protein